MILRNTSLSKVYQIHSCSAVTKRLHSTAPYANCNCKNQQLTLGVKFKLTFIGHSRSNHSVFYLYTATNGGGGLLSTLSCAHAHTQEKCGLCTVRTLHNSVCNLYKSYGSVTKVNLVTNPLLWGVHCKFALVQKKCAH